MTTLPGLLFISLVWCTTHLLLLLQTSALMCICKTLNLCMCRAQVLDRGERIELLVHKTDALQSQAFSFRRESRRLKNQMW